MKVKYSKKKLFIIWVSGGFLSSLIGIVPSVIYWSKIEPNWGLNIPNEIIGCSLMVPIGWLFWALIPLSWQLTSCAWVSIGAFIWSIKTHKVEALYIAFLACFIFGIFWPQTYWKMMSV